MNLQKKDNNPKLSEAQNIKQKIKKTNVFIERMRLN